MNSFTWLHLTDLHFGLDGQKILWPNIREKFFDDLERHREKEGTWDAVLFTGDLVQSGSPEQFDALEEQVLGPLWERFSKMGMPSPVLLAVPGNHDLVRPDTSKKRPAALRMMLERFRDVEDDFWSDPKGEYREIISGAFENYSNWIAKNSRCDGVILTNGELPGDFCATIQVGAATEALKIGVAGINTTFLQIDTGNFVGRLVLDPRQLHSASGGDLSTWAKSHDACILLTHQGLEWMDISSQLDAYAEINPAGRFAVHLFGHMHENTLRSSSSGGGKVIRYWQGNSLFGLEKFGPPPGVERRHGYSTGRIEFTGSQATIQQWPRRAVKDPVNGWRFIPDSESCVLDESRGCTTPEVLAGCCRLPSGHVDPVGAATEQGLSKVPKAEDSLRWLNKMEMQLRHALEAFKDQPIVFVEPKLSKVREFNDDPNELERVLSNPQDTIIIAPSEFGLTCLGLHLRLEAFKRGSFWLFIDSETTKARKIANLIEEGLVDFEQSKEDLGCIILDNWNSSNLDHLTMVKNIEAQCPTIPIIILAHDSLPPDAAGNLAKLNRDFEVLHLQAMSRNSMRRLVNGYNEKGNLGTEDVVLGRLADHFEAINIHRTPLNCLTLLRVLDGGFNERLLNKSKLMKAIIFVLFADQGSYSFLSDSPDVDECAYVMGCFCAELVQKGTRSFPANTFVPKLEEVCRSMKVSINIPAVVSMLRDNNILVESDGQMSFRHRHWVFFFAAEWMLHNQEFCEYVLSDRNYINFPEVIEYYAGADGKRDDALEVLLSDLNALIDQVNSNVGIEGPFDPLSKLLWRPTDAYIEQTRIRIAEKVQSSTLPASIKDKYNDGVYQSGAPYDQSISMFLKDYAVLGLMNSIKASSRALRSSPFAEAGLRHKLAAAVMQGWEEISRVAFWISPILAKEGRAAHDGFAIMLAEGFSDDLEQRTKQIICTNPYNIVRILGPDLASKKLLPLLRDCFQSTESFIQKHMIVLFNISVKPADWYEETLQYINLLHPRSFYLGDVLSALTEEITLGDLEKGEEILLKRLSRAILSKREYAPKHSWDKEIPPNKLLNAENKLPIDQLVKGNRQSWRPDD